MQEENDYVFHRNFNVNYPIISHGEGVYLFSEYGKKYIDASSGAITVNFGHGIKEIINKMQEQAKKVSFVHSLRFETKVLHKLSELIASLAPINLNKVFYTSGGSEANESAIKLAHQYHFDRGNTKKHLVIGNWQSYHGNTIGALSAGGDLKRRKSFGKLLLPFLHVDSNENSSISNLVNLEEIIQNAGSEYISAFICEPIVGSQQGAKIPPKGYLSEVKKICEKYDIIFIVDEVMTGFGRTGKNFAVDHFNVEPDIMTFGKGVSGGYAPLGGMIVHNRIVDSIKKYSDGQFKHGYTYSGHPVSVAAGLATVQYYMKNDILKKCQNRSSYLFKELNKLKSKHSIIKDIRGKGMLIGLELYSSIDCKGNQRVSSNHLNEIAMELGAVFYPGAAVKDKTEKPHLLIAPPLTITEVEIDEMIAILDRALYLFHKELKNS